MGMTGGTAHCIRHRRFFSVNRIKRYRCFTEKRVSENAMLIFDAPREGRKITQMNGFDIRFLMLIDVGDIHITQILAFIALTPTLPQYTIPSPHSFSHITHRANTKRAAAYIFLYRFASL